MTVNDTDSGTLHPCRLFCIFARNAKMGILFRRGPSKWVRLVKWNTENDIFEFGQWFHGRIYEYRCDLSPDGRLLIYFASKFNSKTLADNLSIMDGIRGRFTKDATQPHYTYAWTAISKPPWFTALALWPKGDCWHGGGLFQDDRTIWLNHSPSQASPHPKHRPVGLTIHPNPETHGEDWPVYSARLTRDGWKLEQEGKFPHSKSGTRTTEQEEVFSRRSACGQYDLLMTRKAIDFEAYGGPGVLVFSLRQVSAGKMTDLGPGTWADWDHRDRLILAREGTLLHYELSEEGGFLPRLIYDFNGDRPLAIQSPPEASSWD